MTRRQCAKCPWKVGTNPREIPRGYSEEKHRALASTIAVPASLEQLAETEIRMMACHETHDTACVGWLMHQLGPGNNLALRVLAMTGRIDTDVETVGEQHTSLEDTLPGDATTDEE